VVAPAQTPRAIVQQLNRDIVEILKQADTRERFQRQGADAVITTPAEFQKLIQAEYSKYRTLIRDTGISAQ
jgi:tripartite-type tricarboxylate transporter receptor subunit TctC